MLSNPSYQKVLTAAYITIILVSQLFYNISLLSEICKGNSGFGRALWITLVPWVIIFGGIQGLLMTFPSWLSPFSNTFGYLVAKLAGVNSLLFKILKTPSTVTGAGNNTLKKTLHNIYSDPSLFINEITPENFDDFVRNSSFMFVPNAASMPEMMKLRNVIRMKELISELIWYLLSGILATTVSYNTIANSECTNSVAEMKKRHDEYEQNVKQKAQEEKNAKPPRVYYIRD
jgi:hypothetical protein